MKVHKLLKAGTLGAFFALAFSTAVSAQPIQFDQKTAASCTSVLNQALDAVGRPKPSPQGVPELSVNAAGSAAVILLCGLLVIAGRRRKSGEISAQ